MNAYPLSLPDALPIFGRERALLAVGLGREVRLDYSRVLAAGQPDEVIGSGSPDERRKLGRRPRRELADGREDRKSTRLNSSHRCTSYAVFCLKKKKKK